MHFKKIMNNKNTKELFIQLRVLKNSRIQLIKDFLDCKYEIYEPSYKYENDPIVLKIAREKYFMSWLSNHWFHFYDIAVLDASYNMTSLKIDFAKTFLELTTRFSIIKSTDYHQFTLTLELLEDLNQSLSNFINSSDNAQIMLNKIKLANVKNNILFDRMFEHMSKKEK
jgi:Ni,Fe-hydrogenase I large subunit